MSITFTTVDTPLLMVKGTGLTPMQRIIKRAMDLVLCGIAMIPAAPVMLIIAAAIKIEDGGPVFYKQRRCTRDNREFNILNLRWMQVVYELHKIQAIIQDVVCRGRTRFLPLSDFRHSTAGFAGVFAA